MTKYPLLLTVALTALFACTPSRNNATARLSPYDEADETNEWSGSEKKGGSGLSGAELKLWNDPSFKHRYAESYIAETEIEPRVTTVERDLIEQVRELISADRMDEAAGLLEDSQGDAASAVIDFMLASIYFQQEKLDRAARSYRVAVKKYAKFRRAWRSLGMVYIRQSEFEKALPSLRRVVELGGGDAITYGLMGFAYSSIGNHVSAESAYRMAILLDPETMDWKMGLARSFFKQERYADAISLTGNLIEKQPDRADLWLLQANAYVGMSQPQRAAENLELVDKLGKSTFTSLNMLGDIYINEELYDLAVSSYVRAMKKKPDGDPARSIRAARVLSARGARAETKALIGHIEDHYGDRLKTEQRTAILKLRARIAVAEGAEEEEARVLEEIVKLDPRDGEAIILLGQHYGRHENFERAVFYYERAAGLEEFEPDALVRHAQLLVNRGKYSEALPKLRRAQQIKHRDSIQKYLEQVERAAKRSQ